MSSVVALRNVKFWVASWAFASAIGLCMIVDGNAGTVRLWTCVVYYIYAFLLSDMYMRRDTPAIYSTLSLWSTGPVLLGLISW
jgi:hypothetical protein